MLSRLFGLKVGVRQGSLVSPTLFNIFINELETLNIGVKIGDRVVPALFYADDVCLMASSPTDLQRLLDVASAFARKWKLSYNLSKTKVLPIRASKYKSDPKMSDFRLSGGKVEVASSYKYLGVEFEQRRGWRLVVKRLCKSARKSCAQAMWMAQQSDGLRPETGKKLYETTVRPIMEYGSEIWTTNKGAAKELEKVQRAALRRIMGCRPSAKTSLLLNEMGVMPLATRRDMAVLRLFNKLKSFEPQSLIGSVLRERMRTAAKKPNGQGFCARALRLLDKYSLAYAAGVDDEWQQSIWSKVVDAKVMERAVNTRRAEITLETHRHKERATFYMSLSPAFSAHLQSYLLVPPIRSRPAKLQFQLRVGASDLRAHCYGLEKSNCPLCDAPAEDTDHFLLRCPAYQDLRSQMIARASARAVKLAPNCDPADLPVTPAFLLSSSRPRCPAHLDKELSRFVQRYITLAFRRRQELTMTRR